MFTGLIKDIGTIRSITPNNTGREFVIEAPQLYSEIEVDDSVATNGCCLTATKISEKTFTVQAVHVTLEKTNLGKLKIGDKVNLELALRPMDRLGGHFVQGHVNGIGKLQSVIPRGKNWEITITCPRELFKYMISEGSIAIDGISLTIARLTDTSFTVSIIPHTYENTILHTKKVGDSVNIEVDMMAKYLENFMLYNQKFSLDKWYKDQNK
jgi:riboflavin synthase